MSKIPVDITKTLGLNIKDLCPFSYAQLKSVDHSAHYVSHIMEYELPGDTCKNATFKDQQLPFKGATLKVNDLFNACTEKAPLTKKPNTLTECLIFVTIGSNIVDDGRKLEMKHHAKMYVGILSDNKVWYYSNDREKVIVDGMSKFQDIFNHSYKTHGTTVEFYYGKFF